MPITLPRLVLVLGALGFLGLGAYFLQPSFQSLSLQIVLWQRELHRALTLAITEFSALSDTATWATLLGISFGYGVFHAAGPGHGKAVIAAYLASHDSSSKRTALWMSFASSLVQGITAIILVSILIIGLGWVTRQAMGSVYWVEQASFAMVTLLGGWLCVRAIKRLRQPTDSAHCCGGHHSSINSIKANDWRAALGVILSVGVRPCSGAVLLLGAALLLGEFVVGVVAVLVMSLGTAITVSALALLSVYAREWAERWAITPNPRQRQIGGWLALIGGLMIMLLGISLLAASGGQPMTSPLISTPPLRPI